MMVLSARAIQQIRADHRRLQQLRPSLEGDLAAKRESRDRIRVAIVGSLAAPTGALGTPTQCWGAVLRLDAATKLLAVTAARVRLYNYSRGLNAQDGTYALAEFRGVWELYWVDCSPSTGLTGLTGG